MKVAQTNFFENDFGTINFEKVSIISEKIEFNFKTIAYIEIIAKRSFLKNKYFSRIIFTNATLKDIPIKKHDIDNAKNFETQFLYARFKNSEIE